MARQGGEEGDGGIWYLVGVIYLVLLVNGEGYTHVNQQLTAVPVATLHGHYSLLVPQGRRGRRVRGGGGGGSGVSAPANAIPQGVYTGTNQKTPRGMAAIHQLEMLALSTQYLGQNTPLRHPCRMDRGQCVGFKSTLLNACTQASIPSKATNHVWVHGC